MIGLPAEAGIGPRGMAGPRASRRHRRSRRRWRRISPARPTCSSTSTGSATRTAPTAGSCAAAWRCSGCAGARDRIAGSLTDTTEQAIAQERLRSVGFLDPLTGLCNRAVFVEGLGRRLEEFKQRRGSSSFAVLYLDLDRFKVVNDSLGHLVGDELLIAVSRRLESCLRQGDALARLGGDEFAILLNGLGDERRPTPSRSGSRTR